MGNLGFQGMRVSCSKGPFSHNNIDFFCLRCGRIALFEHLACASMFVLISILTLMYLHAALQNVAKHAEPAAEEISQDIESGARRLGKTAPKATRELTGGAVDAAHELAKSAKPIADQVRNCCRWLCTHYKWFRGHNLLQACT